VRLDMSWDALSVGYQRAEVTNWMKEAKADGLSVLVTIDHSDRVITERVHGRTRRFPRPAFCRPWPSTATRSRRSASSFPW